MIASSRQAGALLAAIASPHRTFDAIVVGEYERAFYGRQLHKLMPFFQRHDIAVWLPEAGGPIDLDDPAHQTLLLLLGHQSQRKVLRSRFRTTAAMCAQVREQAGTSAAADHPTATAWSTPAHIRTRPMPAGDGGCTASTPIPETAHHVSASSAEDRRPGVCQAMMTANAAS